MTTQEVDRTEMMDGGTDEDGGVRGGDGPNFLKLYTAAVALSAGLFALAWDDAAHGRSGLLPLLGAVAGVAVAVLLRLGRRPLSVAPRESPDAGVREVR